MSKSVIEQTETGGQLSFELEASKGIKFCKFQNPTVFFFNFPTILGMIF